MKDPNKPDEFEGQLRKAFIGTEPNKAPKPAKNKKADEVAPKPKIAHG
jgi:hypothetical protein